MSRWKQRHARRLAIRTSISLLIGLAVTFATAWVIALEIRFYDTKWDAGAAMIGYRPNPDITLLGAANIAMSNEPKAEVIWGRIDPYRSAIVSNTRPDPWIYPVDDLKSQAHGHERTKAPLASGAVITRLERLTKEFSTYTGSGYTGSIIQYSFGWPLQSMGYFKVVSSSPNSTGVHTESEYLLPLDYRSFWRFGVREVYAPLHVIPLGFAVDTLFYAALILIPWELAGLARRTRRRRRNRCPLCAYSLDGVPDATRCPECGGKTSPRREPRDPKADAPPAHGPGPATTIPMEPRT